MSQYVISTLTADTRYAAWGKNAGKNSVLRTVLVRGGAGVANKLHVIPKAVRTDVSKEEAEFLSTHPHFKKHQERGFVKLLTITKDPESVGQSMTPDNGGRPRNAKDVEDYSKSLEEKGQDPLQAVTNKK